MNFAQIKNDDIYRLYFEDQTKQSGFRVIYHETVKTNQEEILYEALYFNNEYSFPIENEWLLRFEESQQLVSNRDYRFN